MKAPTLKLPPVELRDPKDLTVGNHTYFYGYPGGADAFFTEGRVSALHPYQDSVVIKTTAGFSSGGSGGGLFDSLGRLVGITTFFSASHSGGYYALPSDWLHDLRKREGKKIAPIKVSNKDDDVAGQSCEMYLDIHAMRVSFVALRTRTTSYCHDT